MDCLYVCYSGKESKDLEKKGMKGLLVHLLWRVKNDCFSGGSDCGDADEKEQWRMSRQERETVEQRRRLWLFGQWRLVCIIIRESIRDLALNSVLCEAAPCLDRILTVLVRVYEKENRRRRFCQSAT